MRWLELVRKIRRASEVWLLIEVTASVIVRVTSMVYVSIRVSLWWLRLLLGVHDMMRHSVRRVAIRSMQQVLWGILEPHWSRFGVRITVHCD